MFTTLDFYTDRTQMAVPLRRGMSILFLAASGVGSAAWAADILINTDNLTINGGASSLYGTTFSAGVTGGSQVAEFLFNGDLLIKPGDVVRISGSRALSLFAANNANIGAGSQFLLSASGDVPGPGGGYGGTYGSVTPSYEAPYGGYSGSGGNGQRFDTPGCFLGCNYTGPYAGSRGWGGWARNGLAGAGGVSGKAGAGNPLGGGVGGSGGTAGVGGTGGSEAYPGGSPGGAAHDGYPGISGGSGSGGESGGNGVSGAGGHNAAFGLVVTGGGDRKSVV